MENRQHEAARVFEEALDRAPAEREAYVRAACGSDVVLAQAVLSLLATDQRATGFLEAAALVPRFVDQILEEGRPDEAENDAARSHPDLGRVVGKYRLRSLLGRGGMGSVFLAERDGGDFEQQVAVKLLRRGMDTEDLLARFEHERRLLARLEHPNIARLLDGGTAVDGRPYLVMEYVRGRPLDAYCEHADLGVRERVEVFLQVCDAVQHAHRFLVVHRDLKPSNILVDDDGTVKLLDFGIAKVLDPDDDDRRTATHVRLLSPRYASPEQLRGEPVSTASDVYALGVVLYEILTGNSPYADADGTLDELQRRILEIEPRSPSTAVTNTRAPAHDAAATSGLRRALRGDLDVIVLQALRKSPERRYGSVEEFAADLRRYLEGRPVLARPDSFGYRARKFVRRNALAVGLGSVALLSLLGATALSTTAYLRAERAQNRAHIDRRTAEEVSTFLQSIFSSLDPDRTRGRDTSLLEELLRDAAARVDTELAEQPVVAATLHHTLGEAYHAIGRVERATTHLMRAQQIDPHGPVSRVVDLGNHLHEIGRHAEAREHLDVAVRRARAAADVVSEARALYWGGRVREIEGSVDSALVYVRSADALLRAHGLDAHRLVVLGGLASILLNARQSFAEADSVLSTALDVVESSGAGPVQRGQVLQGLANSQRLQGRAEEAVPLFAEAYRTYREAYADDHVQIASLQDEWAGALERLGRFAEAEPLYRNALGVMEKTYGRMHRQVGTLSNNLANVLRKQGRADEAAPLYEETVTIYSHVLGDDHAWVGIVLGNVALNHLDRDDALAALRTAEECRRIRALHFGDPHWRTAAADMVRGAALVRLGRTDEAEAVLRASLAVMDSMQGPDSGPTRDVLDRLRELYERKGGEPPLDLAPRLRG